MSMNILGVIWSGILAWRLLRLDGDRLPFFLYFFLSTLLL